MNGQKSTGLLLALLLLLLAGCASTSAPKSGKDKPERHFNAPSMTVTSASHGHQVLEEIPLESVMDRFDAFDTKGRLISYVGFTDTDTGALVFVDGKLQGSLSRHEALAFYVCRGHAMTTPNRYWASEAGDWVDSLLEALRPETSVELEFSGKSTMQSIREVTENPFIGRIKSLLGMGSNPFGVINTLNTARNDFEAGEQFANEKKEMGQVKPGMSEARLAGIARPQDLAFTADGMVMAYPTHKIEFFVVDGSIRVIQQPSFYYLSRTNAALFYSQGAQWPLCIAKRWREALTEKKERNTAPASASVPDATHGEAKQP